MGGKEDRMIPNEEIDLVSMLNQGEFDLARQSITEKEDTEKKKQKKVIFWDQSYESFRHLYMF